MFDDSDTCSSHVPLASSTHPHPACQTWIWKPCLCPNTGTRANTVTGVGKHPLQKYPSLGLTLLNIFTGMEIWSVPRRPECLHCWQPDVSSSFQLTAAASTLRQMGVHQPCKGHVLTASAGRPLFYSFIELGKNTTKVWVINGKRENV